MLHFYERIAARLYPFRAVFWVIAVATLAGFVAVLFVVPASGDTGWMFLALVVLLWAIAALVLVHAFAHPAPVVPRHAPLAARVLGAVGRGARWGLAIAMTALCIAVLVLSAKSVNVISRTLAG